MSPRQDLLEALESTNRDERLAAARQIALATQFDELDAIRRVRAREVDQWVQRALDEAVAGVPLGRQDDPPDTDSESDDLSERLEEESYARALEDVTGQLAHELSPLIGAVDVFASMEIDDYDHGRTARAVQRLRSAVEAIRALSTAAGAPSYGDVAVNEVVRNIVEGEGRDDVVITYSGRDDLIVDADPRLVDLIVSNGLRNALEATRALQAEDPEDHPVVVSWAATDVDFRISIRDHGAGLPASYARAFDIDVSNKPAHLGMGLAIARRAAKSLGGSVRLQRAKNGMGTLFEVRWPKRPQHT